MISVPIFQPVHHVNRTLAESHTNQLDTYSHDAYHSAFTSMQPSRAQWRLTAITLQHGSVSEARHTSSKSIRHGANLTNPPTRCSSRTKPRTDIKPFTSTNSSVPNFSMSFTASAENIRLDDGVLYANLQTSDGSWSEASFALAQVIGNDNGNLESWNASLRICPVYRSSE